MKEIDFEYLINYLEEEIARLTNANRMCFPGNQETDIGTSLTVGLVEYLSNLLLWVKSAVKVERDRIQSAKDSVDATLYSMMSKSDIKLSDDFKRSLDHACGNALKHDILPMPPSEKNLTSEDCKNMADRLDHLRFELQSRNAANSVQKKAFIEQHATLVGAAFMLRKIAEEKIKENHATI